MSSITPSGNNTGANGNQGANNSSGNQMLQQAFAEALAQAQQTLIISTTGNANLNALRARPN